ncbi:MAG: anti-sigma regulatory factor [Aggregatilineales bacterium]
MMNPPANNTLYFEIRTVQDVATARRRGLMLALDLRFQTADAIRIAVVISELGRNIVAYAGEGSITVIAEKQPRAYIKIVADDKGPGIANLEQVLNGGYTSSGGMGLGVSGSKKLMDEFDIRTEVDKGTTITTVKWLR